MQLSARLPAERVGRVIRQDIRSDDMKDRGDHSLGLVFADYAWPELLPNYSTTDIDNILQRPVSPVQTIAWLTSSVSALSMTMQGH